MTNKTPLKTKLIFRCKISKRRLDEYTKLKDFFGVDSDEEMIKLLIHRYYDQTGNGKNKKEESPTVLDVRSTITGSKAVEGLAIKESLGVDTNKELLHVVIKNMYDRVY